MAQCLHTNRDFIPGLTSTVLSELATTRTKTSPASGWFCRLKNLLTRSSKWFPNRVVCSPVKFRMSRWEGFKRAVEKATEATESAFFFQCSLIIRGFMFSKSRREIVCPMKSVFYKRGDFGISGTSYPPWRLPSNAQIFSPVSNHKRQNIHEGEPESQRRQAMG